MRLSHVHSFTVLLGWARFNGFGYFGMFKRGA